MHQPNPGVHQRVPSCCRLVAQCHSAPVDPWSLALGVAPCVLAGCCAPLPLTVLPARLPLHGTHPMAWCGVARPGVAWHPFVTHWPGAWDLHHASPSETEAMMLWLTLGGLWTSPPPPRPVLWNRACLHLPIVCWPHLPLASPRLGGWGRVWPSMHNQDQPS